MNIIGILYLSLFAQIQEEARSQIIGDVESIAPVGTPGHLSVYGAKAFVLVYAGEKDKELPLAAAATYGEGRIFAIAHSGYLSGSIVETSAGKLVANARAWLSNSGKLEVKVFNELNIKTKEQADNLRQWVYDGGSLLLAECPWGWEQVTSQDMREELPANWVIAPMGICFASGYASTNIGGEYAVSVSWPHASNAGIAVEKLMKQRKAKQLSSTGMFALNAAIASVPKGDEILRPLLEEYFRSTTGRGPTKRKPVQSEEVKDRLWVSLYTTFWKELPVDKITAAPGVEEFPGLVDEAAKRLTVTVENDGSISGWNSTGYYLNAGEVLTLKKKQGDISRWRIRIGCHKDTLWHLDSWRRWPEITVEKPIELNQEGQFEIASPWGGTVYLIPPSKTSKVIVEFSGVVEQPFFVANDIGADDKWKESKNSPAPWAELVGRHVIISMPTASLKKLKDPRAVTDYWDATLMGHCDLAGIPMLKRPERFVGDQQISAGYMHSGYPIMTWMDVVTPSNGRIAPVLDLPLLNKFGNWGYFHELGHNRQRSWWTFGGTGEVTNNLFSLHAGEDMANIVPWNNRWLEGQKKAAANYLKVGADWSKWKQSPGIALVSFAMIQREFGWEPFQTFFSDYEKLPSSSRPKNDQQEIDGWIVRMSLILELDLRPYFAKWGWPISENVSSNKALDELKPWKADFSWAK